MIRTSGLGELLKNTISPSVGQTTVYTLTQEGHTMSLKNGRIQLILCSQTEGHCAVSFSDSVQNNIWNRKFKKTKQCCSIFNLCFCKTS